MALSPQPPKKKKGLVIGLIKPLAFPRAPSLPARRAEPAKRRLNRNGKAHVGVNASMGVGYA